MYEVVGRVGGYIGGKMKRAYTVSQDTKSGMWYAHAKGFAYIPISGSFCEKKSDAREYAKMYDNMPHNVESIERKKKEQWEREFGD